MTSEQKLRGAITKAIAFLDENDVRSPMSGREVAALATLRGALSPQPIGTNLLTAEQARKMIEHMQGDR